MNQKVSKFRINEPPWYPIEEYLPNDYEICKDGVILIRETQRTSTREFISGPCWISALTRSSKGREWGVVVHWIDQDENEQTMAFPARKLTDPRSPLAGDLASLGLKIVPGKERKLMTFLGSMNLPPGLRRRSASQLGWSDADDGGHVFVLPNRTVGLAAEDKVVFQPEEHSPTTRTMYPSGSLEQWKRAVGKLCVGNPILTFSLCSAFAGAILKFSGLDSGGFHFYGLSSKGKTTALQVAASVWGCGGDPAVSEDSYIGRWNTTGNALEATACAHNDGLLVLDEMGTCDAKDFGKVVYDLFGGKGKSRLSKNSTLQAQRAWRILGLSSGEISVRQKIEEESGRRAMTGHLVRLIDIPITHGVIVDTKGYSPSEFVGRIKKACTHYFGSAGPEFLDRLVDHEPEISGLKEKVQRDVDAFEEKLAAGRELEAHQRRVVRRFAAVAVAGSLAVRFSILPFSESEVANATQSALSAWSGDESNKSVGLRGIEAIREFIRCNPGRIRDAVISDNRELAKWSRDLAGYYDSGNQFYLFTKKGFAEATGGMPMDAVLNELERLGLLYTNESGRKTSKHTVDGQRPRLYAINESIMNEWEKD